jgi:hypothetical protein
MIYAYTGIVMIVAGGIVSVLLIVNGRRAMTSGPLIKSDNFDILCLNYIYFYIYINI